MQARSILAGVVLLLGTALTAHPQSPEERVALRAQARQLLIEAREVARNITDDRGQSAILSNIAATFILTGDPHMAHETARFLNDRKQYDDALTSIFMSQIEQRQVAAAAQTLNLLSPEYDASLLVFSMVRVHIAKGDASTAAEWANRITRHHYRAMAMAQVATSRSTRGTNFPTIETALGVAASISDPTEKTSALQSIAQWQHRIGDTVGAQSTLSQVRQILAGLPPDPRGARGLMRLRGLARAYAGIGDATALTEILDALWAQPELRSGADYSGILDQTLVDAAIVLAADGHTDFARGLSLRATNPGAAQLVLAAVGASRAGKGDLEAAQKILESLDNSYARLWLLQAIGVEQRFRGRFVESREAFRAGLAHLGELQDNRCRVAAASDLIPNLSQNGETALAAEAIRSAAEGSPSQTWLWLQHAVFGNWQEALQRARQLDDPVERSIALSDVAHGLALRANSPPAPRGERTPVRLSSSSACMQQLAATAR